MKRVEFDRSPLTDIKTVHPPLRHRHHRGRLLQRGERARPAGLPAQLRRADRAWPMRDHGRAAGDAERHHAFRRRRCANAWKRPISPAPTSATRRTTSPTTRRCRCCWTRSIPAPRWSRSTTRSPAARPSGDIIFDTLGSLLAGRFHGFARETHPVRLRTEGDAMAEPRLIEISPVTRVEGHGKVTIHLDARQPGRRGAAAYRRVSRLRAVHPRPAAVGGAGHRAAALRHLPGQPPSGGGQGDGPDRAASTSCRRRPKRCAA